jgi:hypothetical protein
LSHRAVALVINCTFKNLFSLGDNITHLSVSGTQVAFHKLSGAVSNFSFTAAIKSNILEAESLIELVVHPLEAVVISQSAIVSQALTT